MKLDDKLYLIRYNTDKESHITIAEDDVCRKECKHKPCTFICPARVYKWDEEENRIKVYYEGCVECGACRIGCPYSNIKWGYPRGGYGVAYKNG